MEANLAKGEKVKDEAAYTIYIQRRLSGKDGLAETSIFRGLHAVY